MSNLSINLRAIADASVRRVYNNSRPSHSAPSALPLFRAAATQLREASPPPVEAGAGASGSMGLVEVPGQGSGLGFVPPPARPAARVAAAAPPSSTQSTGAGAGAGAGTTPVGTTGVGSGASPSVRGRGTRLRRPNVPIRHAHRGVKRPLPPRFSSQPLPGSSLAADMHPVGSYPGAGPSERVARARIGALDPRRHMAHTTAHIDVGRLRQLSVSEEPSHVRARSLTADSMTPPKRPASAASSGGARAAGADASPSPGAVASAAGGPSTPGAGSSAAAGARADGFRTRRRRAMSLSYGGSRTSSSAAAGSRREQGAGAVVSPPSYGFRTRPRSGSSGGDEAGDSSSAMMHSPVGNSSPRTSTATLLRKAVLLYTRAVAANAKKEGTAPPTAESVRKLISITSTPTVGMQLLRRAENLYRRLFGDTHPSIAAVHKVMGCILVHSGDRKARGMAMEYFNKAAAVCAVTFGPKHAVTMDVEYNIALLHSQNGKHAAAAMGFARVLSSYETAHGDQATPTRFIRAQLRHSREQYRQQRYTMLFSRGLAALQEGQAGVALRAFTEAQQLPLNQRDQQCAYSICVCHCRLGDLAASFEWFRRAVEWGFHDAALLVNDDDIEPLRRLPEFWQLAEERFGLEQPPGLQLEPAGSVASVRTLRASNLVGDTIMEGDEEDDEEGEGDEEVSGAVGQAAGQSGVASGDGTRTDGSGAVKTVSLALESGLLSMSAASAALVSPLHVPQQRAAAAPTAFSPTDVSGESGAASPRDFPAVASASASCGAGGMDMDDGDEDGEGSVRKEEHGSSGSCDE